MGSFSFHFSHYVFGDASFVSFTKNSTGLSIVLQRCIELFCSISLFHFYFKMFSRSLFSEWGKPHACCHVSHFSASSLFICYSQPTKSSYPPAAESQSKDTRRIGMSSTPSKVIGGFFFFCRFSSFLFFCGYVRFFQI